MDTLEAAFEEVGRTMTLFIIIATIIFLIGMNLVGNGSILSKGVILIFIIIMILSIVIDSDFKEDYYSERDVNKIQKEFKNLDCAVTEGNRFSKDQCQKHGTYLTDGKCTKCLRASGWIY